MRVKTVYLDYNATTPLDPEVKEVMLPFLGEYFGNPSSIHRVGRKARAILDDSRERVAQVWKCKASEVVFTSGATESVSQAICGTARFLKSKGRHLITSAVEHHAVLHTVEYLVNKEGFELTTLPVDAEGRVAPQNLYSAIRDDTILVSLMAANNETGAIQPVDELGAICRQRGVLFHTDAVQWFGKEPFESIHQFNADLVTICGHKFYGPKGSGALFIKSPLLPDPILFGGGHENGRRAGTENLAAIAGLVEAIERFVPSPVFDRCKLESLANRLCAMNEFDGINLVSPLAKRLANTASFTVPGIDSMTSLAALDLDGICASAGSACSAGSLNPSHVLSAMGRNDNEANSLIRFSLGRDTSEEEINNVLATFPDFVHRNRSV
ncbi:MAG: cysteine desulfurase [Verrucomicrobia bacterium]|nr:cysteine desulfurase [Verrucomicrobiota bacterium]MBT7909321.1 cysteine desulfurase [Verrucomicrobiota bacterium]